MKLDQVTERSRMSLLFSNRQTMAMKSSIANLYSEYLQRLQINLLKISFLNIIDIRISLGRDMNCIQICSLLTIKQKYYIPFRFLGPKSLKMSFSNCAFNFDSKLSSYYIIINYLDLYKQPLKIVIFNIITPKYANHTPTSTNHPAHPNCPRTLHLQ